MDKVASTNSRLRLRNRILASVSVLVVLGWGVSHPVVAQDADPTRPPARVQTAPTPVTEVRELRLTSIWYRGSDSERRSSAVINGERITAGDRVGNYRVTLIDPDHVYVEHVENADDTLRLRVFRSSNLRIERSSESDYEGTYNNDE